jgi:hypothetical protein
MSINKHAHNIEYTHHVIHSALTSNQTILSYTVRHHLVLIIAEWMNRIELYLQ